ncbi:MAG: hypothetical protein IKB51_07380 [Clostridia bacterium]|nr:hypothetical protein [Clostridia bacterium]
MSKKTEVRCDRCGKEIMAYDIKISSARIDLWALGVPRSYGAQRIDLCENCYNDFVSFLEGGSENGKGTDN